jgi:two-component system, chemotaxis family, chemotaxis protein CheY
MPKILIVDDSNMLRDMLKYALTDGGYTNLTEAADGVEGLEKANSAIYDLIITDVNMPNMNGLELVERLRAIPVYAKTPLLVLTTENTDEMKAKGKTVGATGWIVKPFMPEQLLRAIGMVLKR